MSELCFECGLPAKEQHHVIPRSMGGTKTIPLCSSCHGKVHDMSRLDIRALTKNGLAKRKEAGVKLGAPVKVSDFAVDRLIELRTEGHSMARIADILTAEQVPTATGGDWHASTIKNLLDRQRVVAR